MPGFPDGRQHGRKRVIPVGVDPVRITGRERVAEEPGEVLGESRVAGAKRRANAKSFLILGNHQPDHEDRNGD